MNNQNIQNIGINILTRILLVLCMLLSSSVWAGNDCVDVEGEGNIYFVGPLIPGPNPVALGTVTYNFPDTVRQAMVTAFLLEPPKYTEDGTIHLVTEVQHDFSGGDNLTWRLQMVLSPTEVPGEYRLNEHNILTSGAGIYVDAFARSTGHGTASFNTAQATVLAKGRLCGVAL